MWQLPASMRLATSKARAISRPNTEGRQSVFRVIRDADSIFDTAHPHNGDNGSEALLAVDAHGGRDVVDDGSRPGTHAFPQTGTCPIGRHETVEPAASAAHGASGKSS